MTFIRINNLIFNPDAVIWLQQDVKDINKVTIHFSDGSEQFCEGAESADVWRYFDQGSGWTDDALPRVSD